MIFKYLRLKPTIFFFLNETEPSDIIREKLCESENPLLCFSSIRDEMIMTEKRILIADRKGFTGKKIRCTAQPLYRLCIAVKVYFHIVRGAVHHHQNFLVA